MSRAPCGYHQQMNAVYVVSAIVSAVTILAWLGLLIWGAIEDGRDQDQRDANRPS